MRRGAALLARQDPMSWLPRLIGTDRSDGHTLRRRDGSDLQSVCKRCSALHRGNVRRQIRPPAAAAEARGAHCDHSGARTHA